MTDVIVVETIGGTVVEVTQQPVPVVEVISTAVQTIEIEAAGPQGAQGPQGNQGPQGAQGPQGPAVDTTSLSLDGGNF